MIRIRRRVEFYTRWLWHRLIIGFSIDFHVQAIVSHRIIILVENDKNTFACWSWQCRGNGLHWCSKFAIVFIKLIYLFLWNQIDARFCQWALNRWLWLWDIDEVILDNLFFFIWKFSQNSRVGLAWWCRGWGCSSGG